MVSVTGSVVSVDEKQIRGHVDEVVSSSVEETLNGLLDAEADGSVCKGALFWFWVSPCLVAVGP